MIVNIFTVFIGFLVIPIILFAAGSSLSEGETGVGLILLAGAVISCFLLAWMRSIIFDIIEYQKNPDGPETAAWRRGRVAQAIITRDWVEIIRCLKHSTDKKKQDSFVNKNDSRRNKPPKPGSK
jgi:hypothetical protein